TLAQFILRLERVALGADNADRYGSVARHEAQRLEPARSRIVKFEEEPVDIDTAENLLRDRFVAASGEALPRIAAARMHCDGHAGRTIADTVIDQANERTQHRIGI